MMPKRYKSLRGFFRPHLVIGAGLMLWPLSAMAFGNVPFGEAPMENPEQILLEGTGRPTAPTIIIPQDEAAPPAKQAPEQVPLETTPAETAPNPLSEKVQQKELAPPSAGGIGLLDEQVGGLPVTLWEGSSFASLMTVFHRIGSAENLSPNAHALLRRTLLSNSIVPQDATAPKDQETLFFEARLNTLYHMGEFDDVANLLNLLPSRQQKEAHLRLKAELSLAAGDFPGACKILETGIRRYNDLFWHKGMIFCQIQKGEQEKATLGLRLLQEKEKQDDLFFHLSYVALGQERIKNNLPIKSPLHLALLHLSPTKDLTPTIPEADLLLMRASVFCPSLAPRFRLDLAEKAFAHFAISPISMAKLYEETPLAANLKLKENSAAQRAQFWQKAKATDGTDRAMALQQFLMASDEAVLRLQLLYVAYPLLKSLTPDTEIISLAPQILQSLVLNGHELEEDLPQKWIDLIKNLSDENMKEKLLVQIWPIIRFKANFDMNDNEQIEDILAWWQRYQKIYAGKKPMPDAAFLMTLLSGVGQKTPPEIWKLSAQNDEESLVLSLPANIIMALRASTQAQRLGEAILMSMIVLNQKATPDFLWQDVLQSLTMLGLHDEAANLALEAAIAQGF